MLFKSTNSPRTADPPFIEKEWNGEWSTRIDRILELLKWPIGVVALLATPFLIWANILLMRDIVKKPWGLIFFALGMGSFLWIWNKWLSKNRFGAWLIHFEHELTHLLFALLTFHAVLGFKATGGRDSYVRIRGDGNWLVVAAPYFFPTAAVILWIVSWFLTLGMIPTALPLGFAVGYHIVSTIRETHSQQDDLQKLSFRFCWLFLPAANLMVVGLLIAYSHSGYAGVEEFIHRIFHPTSISIAASS